jgi:L-ascorbate metabolism protein UlaG (beta-lactamase superfamily)
VELSGDRGTRAFRLYITGDTIMYEGLREIPRRHPEIDLALIHLGGTRVMGVTVTMDAAQGVELLETVRPAVGVPIHYDDYEAFKSPLEDFVAAVRASGLEDRVRYVRRGEVLALAAG